MDIIKSILIEFTKKIDKNYIYMLVVSIVVIVPAFNYTHIALMHDGAFHYANVESTIENIRNGNILNGGIMPNIVHDLGYGKGLFYPSLAHVIPAIIAVLLNTSVLIALRLTMYLIIILSGSFMYALIRYIFKDKNIAMFSSISYITFPYFLVDLYIRFSLAELMCFIFLPLTILGLYKVIYEKKKTLLITGMTLMLYSHQVMAMYITMILAIFALLKIKQILNKQVLKSLALSVIAVILLAMPSITPMLEHRLQADYRVFNDSTMVTDEIIISHRLTLEDYIIPYNNFDFQSGKVDVFIPVLAIVFALIGSLGYKKIFKDITTRKTFFVFIVITAVLLIGMSTLVDWENIPDIFKYIQFPWRLSLITTFTISILVGVGMEIFKATEFKIFKNSNLKILKNKINKDYAIAVFIAINIIFSLFSIKTYNVDSNSMEIVEKRVDTYAGAGFQMEYLPTNAYDDLKYLENRGNEVLIQNSSKAVINMGINEVPYLEAVVINNNEETIVELPRLYYLGYEIEYVYNNGNKEELNYYENENGLIEIVLPKENGKIVVRYTNTLLTNVSIVISLLTLTVIIYILIKRKVKETKYKLLSS